MAPSNDKKSLKDVAQETNPSQLGDPVSLKAETSKTTETYQEPTENDRPAKNGDDKRSLKEVAQDKMKQNPSQLGDPVSLKAETSNTEPTEHDRGALGTQKSGKPKM